MKSPVQPTSIHGRRRNSLPQLFIVFMTMCISYSLIKLEPFVVNLFYKGHAISNDYIFTATRPGYRQLLCWYPIPLIAAIIILTGTRPAIRINIGIALCAFIFGLYNIFREEYNDPHWVIFLLLLVPYTIMLFKIRPGWEHNE
ncbi:hypothetical protein [Chitinophaga silvisoli]|uniref:Uncharacterized protein n=1 Tax=Chitinophaga silvisoli TaxID=2291814 RepID=A0A3E1NTD3_9BACT|nr:hypothetical protein [Chitinophaga silvisoli]RFM31201.1 hypothetical protein DXN04_30655 [Chitinophaga silvisoli]